VAVSLLAASSFLRTSQLTAACAELFDTPTDSFLIAYLNWSLPARLLGGEPYIDEEAGRFPIMPG
jgi:hypothetical protein